MALRLALAAMGLAALAYAARGAVRGAITMKGVTARRAAEPVKFWFSVAVVGAFGVMLLAFAVAGRLSG